MRGNIPRIYAFRFLRDFLLIMPAIVPVYRSCGLGATQILLVQAIFSAASVLFEVPSGYLADVLGRRSALLIGAVGMAAGMAAYGLATSFWQFAGAEVVLAFGYSLFSGTESALIYDTLKAESREAEYTRIEGKAEAWTRVGTATAAVAGGLLAAVWLRLPFVANAGTALIMFVIAITLVEPPRPTLAARESLRQILQISRESLADARRVGLSGRSLRGACCRGLVAEEANGSSVFDHDGHCVVLVAYSPSGTSGRPATLPAPRASRAPRPHRGTEGTEIG